MKLHSNWSIASYVVGGLFSLFSAIRYFVIYSDTDKALVYVLIGTMIMGLGWLYNQQLNISNTLDTMEDYLQDRFEK